MTTLVGASLARDHFNMLLASECERIK